jgi:hypothetical protein
VKVQNLRARAMMRGQCEEGKPEGTEEEGSVM